MAGRKPLVLTNTDYFDVLRHINKLMFKRKCEQKLLDIFSISKEKFEYNKHRADHKKDARSKEDGKKI